MKASKKRSGAPSHEGAVMTCAEIAVAMGVSEKTVENILRRALAKLRPIMSKGEPR
jgi:DNA-directed RNA polymerase specialized sigma24 family protein